MSLPNPFGKNKAFRLTVFGLLAVAALFVGFSLSSPKASADACSVLYAPGGRNCRIGYFKNTYDGFGHNIYADGMYTYDLNSFVNKIRGYMNCSGGTLLNREEKNATGSAFIILTMLGYAAGQPKDLACQQYSRWLGLVTDYNNAGLIQWNTPINYIGNTYYQDQSDVGWVDPAAPTFSGTAAAIIFMRPDRAVPLYVIKHECANPIGSMWPLEPFRIPIGTFDAADCTILRGTAWDPDTPNSPVRIRAEYSNGDATETFTNPATRAWSMAPPPSVTGNLYPVTVRTYAYDTSLGTRYMMAPGARTIGPCVVPDPACAGFTITPATLDPSTTYNIQARVNYGSDAVATAVYNQTPNQFYVRVTGPNGPTVVYTRSASIRTNPPVSRSGATFTFSTGDLPATGRTGTYVVSWGITGGPGSIDCGGDGTVPPGPGDPNNPPATFDVTNQPYFRINGGDASVGAGMSVGGVDCAVPANPLAGIVSWNRGASNNYAGAGTGYAAMALNHLQEFATAQGQATLRPSRLAFANDASGGVNIANGLYGGLFGGLPCIDDYYSTLPANARAWSTFSQTTPNVVSAYRANGPHTFFTATTIPTGDHITLYVNGDVYISGNITFAGGGSYANAAAVPSFKLVARGNIYIAPWVTQLDGTYVAQPTSTSSNDGNIYTCGLVSASPSDPAHPYRPASLNGSLYTTCQNQLTVNGAFIANDVWLLRTDGSVSNIPAETFNFSPELWITSPYDSSTGNSSSGKYDAITSLPPVL